MRKKTISYLSDNIFWYMLYFLPVLMFIILSFKMGTFITLADVFTNMGLSIVADNVILTALSDIFLVGGVFPIFATNDILIFFTWFIGVYIAHLFVDFLLFIPRLAHKWMDAFCKGDE